MKNKHYNKDETMLPCSGVEFLSKTQADDGKGWFAEWLSAEVWLPRLPRLISTLTALVWPYDLGQVRWPAGAFFAFYKTGIMIQDLW